MCEETYVAQMSHRASVLLRKCPGNKKFLGRSGEYSRKSLRLRRRICCRRIRGDFDETQPVPNLRAAHHDELPSRCQLDRKRVDQRQDRVSLEYRRRKVAERMGPFRRKKNSFSLEAELERADFPSSPRRKRGLRRRRRRLRWKLPT